jgi:hypothetical protein
MNGKAHKDLRPDNCGVVFEKYSDRVIVGSQEPTISEELVMNQIKYFQNEGISVLLVDLPNKTRSFYLAEGHTLDTVEQDIRKRS